MKKQSIAIKDRGHRLVRSQVRTIASEGRHRGMIVSFEVSSESLAISDFRLISSRCISVCPYPILPNCILY